VGPVRAALLDVKGVSRARVMLEGHEAIVTFDPKLATTTDLINAVAAAEGPAGPNQYNARVKAEKPPA
jgi:copper chaperone CopZ